MHGLGAQHPQEIRDTGPAERPGAATPPVMRGWVYGTTAPRRSRLVWLPEGTNPPASHFVPELGLTLTLEGELRGHDTTDPTVVPYEGPVQAAGWQAPEPWRTWRHVGGVA